MPDIFAYASEPLPNDVRLSDPTVPRGGPSFFGILKRWTGAAWVKALLKTYLGGSWQTKPLKRWDGSEWKLVDSTGV